jgi:NADH:ubiquinone oxidoreductase subunit H
MAEFLTLIGVSLVVIFAAFVVVVSLIVAERAGTNVLRTGIWPTWSGLSGLVESLLKVVTRIGDVSQSWRGWSVAVLGEVLFVGSAIFPLVVLPLLLGSSNGGLPELSIAPACKVDLLLIAGAWIVGLAGRALMAEDVGREAGSFLAILVATLGVTFLSGSLDLDEMSHSQLRAWVWWVGVQPLGLVACLVGVASMFVGDVRQSDQTTGLEVSSGDFVDRLRLIVMAYLVVSLFFGGWHLADASGATFGDRFVRALVLHLKSLLFMAVFVWFRVRVLTMIGFRLPSGLWGVALGLGGVNLVVVLLQEQLLGPGEWLLKSAMNWVALAVCLAVSSVVMEREDDDEPSARPERFEKTSRRDIEPNL